MGYVRFRLLYPRHPQLNAAGTGLEDCAGRLSDCFHAYGDL